MMIYGIPAPGPSIFTKRTLLVILYPAWFLATKNDGKSTVHHFEWENPLFLWHFEWVNHYGLIISGWW